MKRHRQKLGVAILSVLLIIAPSQSAALNTDDGLQLTFSDDQGAITAVTINGAAVPLIPSAPGGLSIQVGSRIEPAALLSLDFNTSAVTWTTARNANWDDAGPYVTWIPDGGIGNTGHLLLGDGVTTGTGMAIQSPVPVAAGSSVRISWQARSASTDTLQIVCIRIYDSSGNDITYASPAPPGWGWTSTSQAHGVWGLPCSATDTWQAFEQTYRVPAGAASLRASLRYWSGGDCLLHVDDLRIDAVGGIVWSDRLPVIGPVSPIPNGFTQSVDVVGQNLRVETNVTAIDGHLSAGVVLQDLSSPQIDRPIQLFWTLPVAATGWQWWDDIDTSRVIAAGTTYRNAFTLAGHAVSLYPFSAITNDSFGLSLAVPMSETVVQRFEAETTVGLRSVWELALTPLTARLGPGRAAVSVVLSHHDPAWGFRAAADKYYSVFPDFFTKRTTREGAWLYPVHPNQIPDPEDFGFAYHETWTLDASERAACEQHNVGIFYYTNPFTARQSWGNYPDKPPYEDRVAKLESWAAGEGSYATRQPEGGVENTGHLLLGDGSTTGAGMATASAFPVIPGHTVSISWHAKSASTATTQILSVRIFDGAGNDVTPMTPAPPGWNWSSTSQAHVISGIANSLPDTWQPFSQSYGTPLGIAAMQVSLRYWNGGDYFVHIDGFRVDDATDPTTYLLLTFDTDDDPWVSARNDDWADAGPAWLRVPRRQTAQTVMNSSPLDAAGRYLIDTGPSLWYETNPDDWGQAWSLNPDPDLPDPNAFSLYREHWILYSLDDNDGVYIDNVLVSSPLGAWENRRADHLAVCDSPLTFSWTDGGPAQLAPQAYAEFLTPIAAEVRGLGKLMMLNLFAEASRFHAYNADVMGSEVTALVESGTRSRVRRTLARQRIVSNLLQWGWDSPTYITYEQMEQFIRGQLFWGFYPAVSSGGGMLTGGAPDRYFLHPELYERDRPLFQKYVPVIKQLGTAGWEPVTRATGEPATEIERFGDFSRGPAYLTVRGPAGAAWQGQITLDLIACGLAGGFLRVNGTDVLAQQPLQIERLPEPAQARFNVSLAAGEVGVYEFEPLGFVLADFDEDADADLMDFSFFQRCFNGPNRPAAQPDCGFADIDGDADVDLADFAIFQGCFNGPNRSPQCD